MSTVQDPVPRAKPTEKATNIISSSWFKQIMQNNCPSNQGRSLTIAVPAKATSAERKLKNRALDTLNPDLTRIPKSPTYKEPSH